MKKLLAGISDRLGSFITQRDDLALVVSSAPTDAPALTKILEGLEAESSSDLFWICTQDFTTAQEYATAVVKGFFTKHTLMQVVMEKEGLVPWPPIPSNIVSEDSPPASRLRALTAFSRELLPVPNGGKSVWIFYPLQISDHGGYAAFMDDLLQHEFPFPWCHHLRFIIREDAADRALQRRLSQTPRIQWYELDLSTEALNRSMEAEIADNAVPLAERMNSLLVMAAIDGAYHRLPEALEKYELLLQYHASMNNYPLAALAMNGIGETYEKMGDLDKAGESYESALIPATKGEHPPIPIFLNVVVNLANLRRTQERWDEAEAYFDMAQQLATVNRDATLKIRSLENRGSCQYPQRKYEEACQSWNDALVMAAQLQDTELCQGLLERLRQHYADTHQPDRERELNEQLAAFKS